jgi:hypothetical protein
LRENLRWCVVGVVGVVGDGGVRNGGDCRSGTLSNNVSLV